MSTYNSLLTLALLTILSYFTLVNFTVATVPKQYQDDTQNCEGNIYVNCGSIDEKFDDPDYIAKHLGQELIKFDNSYMFFNAINFDAPLVSLQVVNGSQISIDHFKYIGDEDDNTIDVYIDDGLLTLRNQQEADINTLTFNNTHNEGLAKQGLEIKGISIFKINEIKYDDSCSLNACHSTLILDQSLIELNINTGHIDELYFYSGVLTLTGEVSIDTVFPATPDEPQPPEIGKNTYSNDNDNNDDEIYLQHFIVNYIPPKSDTETDNEIQPNKIIPTVTVGQMIVDEVSIASGNLSITKSLKAKTINNNVSESDPSAISELILSVGSEVYTNYIYLENLTMLPNSTLEINTSGSIINLQNKQPKYTTTPTDTTIIFNGCLYPNTQNCQPPEEEEDDNDDDNEFTEPAVLKLDNVVHLNNLYVFDGVVELSGSEMHIDHISNMLPDTVLDDRDCEAEACEAIILEYANLYSNDISIYKVTLYASNLYLEGQILSNELIINNRSNLEFTNLTNLEVNKLTITNNSTITNLDNLIVHDYLLLNSSGILKANNADLTGDINIFIDNNILDDEYTLKNGLEAQNEIYIHDAEFKVALNNTSYFTTNLSRQYMVLKANNINYDTETSIFKTSLPYWFSAKYSIVNNPQDNTQNFISTIERTMSYQELVLASSTYSDNQNTLNVAHAIDEMINDQNIPDHMRYVITDIDLLSNEDSIAGNLNSMLPIDSSVFLHNTHTISDTIANMVNNYSGILQNNPLNHDQIWIKDSYLHGNTSASSVENGNSFDNLIVQFGYEIYHNSNFYLNMFGGTSIGSIHSTTDTYLLNNISYDLGLDADYYHGNWHLSWLTMYNHNVFENDRQVFNNDNLLSDNSITEWYNKLTIDNKFNIATTNQMLNYRRIYSFTLRPQLYITYNYLKANDIVEQGHGSIISDAFSDQITDIGIGISSYTNDKNNNLTETLQYNLDLFVFYRMWETPTTENKFTGDQNYQDDDKYHFAMISNDFSNFGINFKTGLSYNNQENIIGVYYEYETLFNYSSKHDIMLSYKLLLN